MTKEMFQDLLAKALKVNITIEFHSNFSDEQKFKQIAMAKALVFPSSFEGYGYPPLEATYCNTPAVCYELDVLKEVGDNSYFFAENGNIDAFRDKLLEVLTKSVDIPTEESLTKAANFERFAKELDEFFSEIQAKDLSLDLLSFSIPREKMFVPLNKLSKRYIWFLIRTLKDYIRGRKNWLYQN